MKQKGKNFQKWRWAIRVFNTLLIAAFVLVIVFNAKEMPAWLIVLISLHLFGRTIYQSHRRNHARKGGIQRRASETKPISQ